MTNSSATGGYLAPTINTNLYDKAFESFFHDVITGICGYPNDLVRPQGQRVPPQLPPIETNWCSFLIVSERDLNLRGQTHHDPAGDGSDILERTVECRILLSFYGPDAFAYADGFSDGLCIEQNRWQLNAANFGLVHVGERRVFYELINQEHMKRVDVEIRVYRDIRKVYPVLNLLQAVGTIYGNAGEKTLTTDFDTES